MTQRPAPRPCAVGVLVECISSGCNRNVPPVGPPPLPGTLVHLSCVYSACTFVDGHSRIQRQQQQRLAPSSLLCELLMIANACCFVPYVGRKRVHSLILLHGDCIKDSSLTTEKKGHVCVCVLSVPSERERAAHMRKKVCSFLLFSRWRDRKEPLLSSFTGYPTPRARFIIEGE